MGVIKQQTIKGSFYSYLGVFIGFLTAYLIQPQILRPDEIGLLTILTSFSIMFAQFSILGFNATARYFPYFRDEANKHNGYLAIAIAVSAFGFLLFCIAAIGLKDIFLKQENTGNYLLVKYYWYLIPLTFFTLFFNVFDLYARMLYDTITGRTLNEFTKRIFILIALVFILVKLVDFEQFILLWLVANILPALLLVYKLHKRKWLHIKPNFKFLDKSVRKQLISLCLFGIITGSAPYIVQNADKYIITKMFGLAQTGIYSIAAAFGAIITLPARSLYTIAYTVIAEAWKANDLKSIESIYRKSCINQLIVALYLFIVMWANITNIFHVLPPEYKAGEYVLFFVGLGFLIDSSTGVNGVIMATSRYYKYDSFFNVALIGVTIGANLLFIPIYGLTGAAIATAFTYFVFNLARYLFIKLVFGMQPFSLKTLLTLLIGLLAYGIVNAVPPVSNFIADGLIRLTAITILYCGSLYYLKLSPDINQTIDAYIGRLRK